MKVLVSQSCPTLCNPIGCRLLCPWDSPDKNTEVGCHFLLQGTFPTNGLNPGLLHCRQILYHLNHQGSPNVYLSHFVYPFSCRWYLDFFHLLAIVYSAAVTWVYMKSSLIPSSLSSREWISPIFIRILVLFMPCTTSYQYYSVLHGTKIMFNVRHVWGFELCIALDTFIHTHSYVWLTSCKIPQRNSAPTR